MTTEKNLTRARSILARSARLFRAACAAHRARPNVATAQRRVDRGLAFLAQRARVVAVRLMDPTFRPTLRGAARAAAIAKAQRIAGQTAAEWRSNYNAKHAL